MPAPESFLAQRRELPDFREILARAGEPAVWELDEDGCPMWLRSLPCVDCVPWIAINPGSDTDLLPTLADRWRSPHLHQLRRWPPAAMPRMPRREEVAPPRGPGRPGRMREQPELCAYIAWLHDIKSMTLAAIAREWTFGGPEQTARTTARRYRDEGRTLLNAERVLPWVFWDNGVMPNDWWSSTTWIDGLIFSWYSRVWLLQPLLRQLKERVRAAAEYHRAENLFFAELGSQGPRRA
jgi:hypothetical protein